ncbi:hypothetical protein AG1IA_08086 [Rhizoctonia solani AG-1 IA]|uniref:Uncharacterized protein n=1 Tax=Thanatephorus cucumeris (strain AG1-IA) TaxID=983506 RepID=L8WM58_THACA|nr:hypothetical protein AG1IA_08086 [Rhizoctonia solani AG-1 IA]
MVLRSLRLSFRRGRIITTVGVRGCGSELAETHESKTRRPAGSRSNHVVYTPLRPPPHSHPYGHYPELGLKPHVSRHATLACLGPAITHLPHIVRPAHPPASSARVSVPQLSSGHFVPDPPTLAGF